MGPEKAALYMLTHYPQADAFRVTLYGSLSKTGHGHGTDHALIATFAPLPCQIDWDTQTTDLPHPNTMDITATRKGVPLATERILSIGGGAIRVLSATHGGEPAVQPEEIYPHNTFNSIWEWCEKENITLADYVRLNEGPAIENHLHHVWLQMKETVQAGMHTKGILPGGLNMQRRATQLAEAGLRDRNLLKKEHFLIAAYAYAACEENAAGGRMVTAPTCGASGVVPAVLYYESITFGCSDREIEDALAVAGLIGCIIKQNASVSGAECGCQAEIGSACAMAAGALAALHGLSIEQIECAAEIAMEHFLGLTCDPVGGLVQIPCIERNAVAALRAYDAAALAEVIWDHRKISLDLVIRTMYETGKDLSACYRETADGGLAKLYVKDFY